MSSASNRKAIAAGVAALALIIGGAVWFDQSRQVPEVQEAAAETLADATTTTDAPPDVTTETAEIATMAPAIDTFFRNPDETTVIAGRATPGQTVAIMLGGQAEPPTTVRVNVLSCEPAAAAAPSRPCQMVGTPSAMEIL